MRKQPKIAIALILALLLTAALVSIGSGQSPAAPHPQGMVMDATATPTAVAMDATVAPPVLSSGTDAQSQTQSTPYMMTPMSNGMGTGMMTCPMMSGQIGNMTGMTGIGTMPGMTTSGMMGGMGMQNMGAMQGMAGMQNMGNMSGMMYMPGMNGQGFSTSPLYYRDELEAASFWELNPWWLIGWVVFGILVLGLLAGFITGTIWLIMRIRKPQEAKAPVQP